MKSVFLDGDWEHQDCERTPLRFDEESKRPGWVCRAIPVAMAVAALVTVQVVRPSA